MTAKFCGARKVLSNCHLSFHSAQGVFGVHNSINVLVDLPLRDSCAPRGLLYYAHGALMLHKAGWLVAIQAMNARLHIHTFVIKQLTVLRMR